MTIPNAGQAYVPPEKLSGYLLASGHPGGGPKARFFRALGYTDASAAALERGLLTIAQTSKASVSETPHGTKYVAEGVLHTPSGTLARVRTVWITEPDDLRPRFVTAYPA